MELKVYDSDGQEGINIPNSMENDALHEIGANMGSTMGSSINIHHRCRSADCLNNTDNNVSPDTEQVAEHDMNVYGANYTNGDKFDGLTRKVGFDRMIPPHALEVCYDKTTHIIFLRR